MAKTFVILVGSEDGFEAWRRLHLQYKPQLVTRQGQVLADFAAMVNKPARSVGETWELLTEMERRMKMVRDLTDQGVSDMHVRLPRLWEKRAFRLALSLKRVRNRKLSRERGCIGKSLPQRWKAGCTSVSQRWRGTGQGQQGPWEWTSRRLLHLCRTTRRKKMSKRTWEGLPSCRME